MTLHGRPHEVEGYCAFSRLGLVSLHKEGFAEKL
jgi:hypothetical protein